MRKTSRIIFILIFVAFLFNGCVQQSGTDSGLVFDTSKPYYIREGGTYAPQSVLELAWKSGEGERLIADVTLFLNNHKVQEFPGVTGLTFTVEEEGNYKAVVTVTGTRSSAKTIFFSVNRLWAESLSSVNGSSDGLFYTDTFGEKVAAWINAGHTPFIAFFGLEQSTIPNTVPEIINSQTLLSLSDTDLDGVYDAWKTVSNIIEQVLPLPTRFDEHYGPLVADGFVYREHAIEVWNWYVLTGPDQGTLVAFDNPFLYATVGLSLNQPYTFYMDSYEGEDDYEYGQILKLRALYDSDRVPLFSLAFPVGSPQRGEVFSAVIVAENVADFGKVYNTRYMQIPLFFSTNLAFRGLWFDDFMEGLGELSTYRLFYDEYLDMNVLMLYRAFIEGDDEEAAPSNIFAAAQFEVLDAEPGFVKFYYANFYDTEFTPLFKDNQNKNVDGFIIDYDTAILVNRN